MNRIIVTFLFLLFNSLCYNALCQVPLDSTSLSDESDPMDLVIESLPEYSGGVISMGMFIQQNLNYPKKARRNGAAGKVVVEITIDTDGSVIDAIVISGADLGYGLPEEALRVVRIMPKWIPATSQKNGGPFETIVGKTRVTITFR